ncbi:hypothetical protein [Nonomuraea rubra]|uniref:Uncharacterized protein n=1 Tax=Nonomuraea rubra TaxID=46180 RepID=A0A7X0NMJ7_9ACTN|nr:hypothetical protein [Nonomuraea rubra]MBB6546170.1 hypothetical protein [Nonomuraea rubra]
MSEAKGPGYGWWSYAARERLVQLTLGEPGFEEAAVVLPIGD